jgi:hypothetical protein
VNGVAVGFVRLRHRVAVVESQRQSLALVAGEEIDSAAHAERSLHLRQPGHLHVASLTWGMGGGGQGGTQTQYYKAM